MTTTAPTRVLVLVGAALAALAVVFFVVRPLVLEDDETSTATSTRQTQTTSPQPATSPAQAKPRVQLVPGLPVPVAKQLRYSNVVVVTLFTPRSAGDRRVLAQSRSGARSVNAGFVALNVTNEKRAREVAAFAGATSAPAVLVVKRPGTVVSQFEGATDRAIVAQAALNAGAGEQKQK